MPRIPVLAPNRALALGLALALAAGAAHAQRATVSATVGRVLAPGLYGVLGILPPNIAKTARGRASRDFWRPITYRLSAGSLQSMPLNPQVLADRLSVRTCIYPGG